MQDHHTLKQTKLKRNVAYLEAEHTPFKDSWHWYKGGKYDPSCPLHYDTLIVKQGEIQYVCGRKLPMTNF